MTRVGDGRVECIEEPKSLADFAEQQGPCIGGHLTTEEVGINGL
jgi:hypothetical protein